VLICSFRCNFLCRWETGYWGTMDIMHDRAGYYICWGCLVWVPSVYTSPALFLTEVSTACSIF
jgi:Ergosterol biosynthesis ERG4/ERG24 family